MTGLKLWVKLILFISSFAPLAIIWGYKFKEFSIPFFNNSINIFHFILILISLSCLLLFFAILKVKKTNNPQKKLIKDFKDLNSAHIEYLLAYIFPFLPFGTFNLVPFVIFIFVLLIVYLKSNLIYVNPLLVIFGYNIFEIEDQNKNKIIFITKKNNLIKGDYLKGGILSGNIYIENGK